MSPENKKERVHAARDRREFYILISRTGAGRSERKEEEKKLRIKRHLIDRRLLMLFALLLHVNFVCDRETG